MALSLQGANQVWQKVRMALDNGTTTVPGVKSSARWILLKDLKQYLATYKGNPQLQFIPIDGIYSSSDGGNNASQVLADAACTLYAIVLTKLGTVETIFKASANATTAATDGTNKTSIHAATPTDVVLTWPDGVAVASGLTVTENTARTTSTLTLKANRLDGFAIIGAA